MAGVLVQDQSSEQEKQQFRSWTTAILALCEKGKKPCLAFDCEGIQLGFRRGSLEIIMLSLVGTHCDLQACSSFERNLQADAELYNTSYLIDMGEHADLASVELLGQLLASENLFCYGWGIRNDLAALLGAYAASDAEWSSTMTAPKELEGKPLELKCKFIDMQLFTLQDRNIPHNGIAYCTRVMGLKKFCGRLEVHPEDAEAKDQIQKNICIRVLQEETFDPWFPRPIPAEALQYQIGDIEMIRTVAVKLDGNAYARFYRPWADVLMRSEQLFKQIASMQPSQYAVAEDVHRIYFNLYTRPVAMLDQPLAVFSTKVANQVEGLQAEKKVHHLALLFDRLFKEANISDDNEQEKRLLLERCAVVRDMALPLLS